MITIYSHLHLRFVISFLLLVSIFSPVVLAADEDYDPIKEAIFLLQNQDVAKAKALIAKSEADLDKEAFNFLNGMTAFFEKRFEDAEQKLSSSWANEFRGYQIELYLCQSLLELKKASDCEKYFPAQAQWSAKHYVLAYRSMKTQAQDTKAWGILQTGLQKFTQDRVLVFEKISFLIENHLVNEAESFLKGLPNRGKILDADDTIAIASLFRAKKQGSIAAWLLEEARIEEPKSKKVALELAQTYVQDQKFVSAGEVLQSYARYESKYFLETAELFRRGKAYSRALFTNQFVTDEKEKIKQRFIILVDLGSYGAAASMQHDLRRLGLIAENEDIAYGLAFSFFQEKRFADAEKAMTQIQRPDLFKKVAWIRQSIEGCRAKSWECIL